MIRIHDFGISVKEYFQRGKQNKFPALPCARCQRQDKLKKKGFRWRHVLGPDTGGALLRIPIRVLYCKRCRKLTSILPSFCIPYKIHTVLTFESFFLTVFFTKLPLAQVIERARCDTGYYQLAQAWVKSFKTNLVNLASELRTLLPADPGGNSRPSSSLRYQHLAPAWWSLQRLARQPFPQFPSAALPLEKAQYFLWYRRKLGLFAYLG